jgi:hypothetical protein
MAGGAILLGEFDGGHAEALLKVRINEVGGTMRTSVHHTMDDRGAIRLCAESLKGQKDMGHPRIACVAAWFVSVLAAFAQQVPAPTAEQENPVLSHRPPGTPPSPLIREGKIHLDVVVTDSAGNPVTGLQPWDLKLFDNNQSRKIQSFSAFSHAGVKPDPPVGDHTVDRYCKFAFSAGRVCAW